MSSCITPAMLREFLKDVKTDSFKVEPGSIVEHHYRGISASFVVWDEASPMVPLKPKAESPKPEGWGEFS